MTLFAVIYLVAFGVVAGALIPKPHRADGGAFSVALVVMLVSGLVLAAGAL